MINNVKERVETHSIGISFKVIRGCLFRNEVTTNNEFFKIKFCEIPGKYASGKMKQNTSPQRVSGLRVRLFMNILQLLDGVMGIYLCGRQAAMPQQLFYRIEIGAVIHQVGGKTVA